MRAISILPTIALVCSACIGAPPPAPPPVHARPVDDAHELVDVSATPLGRELRPISDPVVDDDLDGLDDALEEELAVDYLPYLANHPEDECLLSGIVFRARPHPDDASLVSIIYSRLYEQDCGITSHVGDNEAFGTTVDPNVAAPEGLLALVAVSHQSTPCQRTTTCGRCGDLASCELADDGRPILFASKNKHASAADRERGCGLTSCFDTCEMNEVSAAPPLVNVGEPGAPLVTNLTEQGFIDAALGWTAGELFDYDPWGDVEFGSAGKVSGDLVDEAFVAPACR